MANRTAVSGTLTAKGNGPMSSSLGERLRRRLRGGREHGNTPSDSSGPKGRAPKWQPFGYAVFYVTVTAVFRGSNKRSRGSLNTEPSSIRRCWSRKGIIPRLPRTPSVAGTVAVHACSAGISGEQSRFSGTRTLQVSVTCSGFRSVALLQLGAP